jgi:hypothetical protein
MTDENTQVLKEIAGLMKRQVEQRDEITRRLSSGLTGSRDLREAAEQRRSEFAKHREELQNRLEKGKDELVAQRQEDREFKRQLITQLERHNQLLEALLERLGPKS